MRSSFWDQLPGGAPYLTVPDPDIKGFPELMRRDANYWCAQITARCALHPFISVMDETRLQD